MTDVERILVAVADAVALVLTGDERGQVWRVPDSPPDGFWVVETRSAGKDALVWTNWTRPTHEEILAYQDYVIFLAGRHECSE